MYREVTRRLNDGCYLRIQPVMRGREELADWVYVSINNETGATLYTDRESLQEPPRSAFDQRLSRMLHVTPETLAL